MVNQIGESFSSPKQINEPERIAQQRDHFKRKADELLEQQEKKRAKREAENPVAEVLRAYGYVKPGESAVTVTEGLPAAKCAKGPDAKGSYTCEES